MLFAAFISGSSACAPQGSEEPPLRRTHPLQYPLPAGDLGKPSHQACPAIVHTQICPSAALSSCLLSWVSLGRMGPEISLPSLHILLWAQPRPSTGDPLSGCQAHPSWQGSPHSEGLLSSWVGKGKATCCSSSYFSLPSPPAILEEKNLALATKWRPRAWLPPTQRAPRQMPAERGGGRRCASAPAASAARHAGSCSAGGHLPRGQVGGRRAVPRSGSGTLTGLGLHPHPGSGALRALAHTLIPAPAPHSTEASWKTALFCLTQGLVREF